MTSARHFDSMVWRILFGVLAFMAPLLSGCGSVNPEKDFGHAASLVQERTGMDSVYSPSAETCIADRISALLQDGLTEDEAVQIALINNRGFQIQFQDIGVSRAELVQSALFTNPTLSFSARFPDTGGRSNLSFGLAQEIVELWQIPVRKRIARDQLERSILGVATAGIALAANTRQAYTQLRVQQELGQLAKENLERLLETLDITKRRFQAGETTILDVNLIQSSVLDSTLQQARARRDIQIARASLAQMLGLTPEQGNVEAIGAVDEVELDLPDDPALVREALERRLDVQMASSDLDAAQAEIQHQKRSVVPSVTIGLDGERPDVSSTGTAPSLGAQLATLDTLATSPAQALRDQVVNQIDSGRQHRQDKADTVNLLMGPSLQITLPVFDQNQAQVSKAKYQYAQKQKAYEEMLLNVVREVLEASANARAAAEQLKILTAEALPLAESNVETARRVYEAGDESILALILAQQTWHSQREAHVSLAGEYAIARAELERALGGRPNSAPVVPTP